LDSEWHRHLEEVGLFVAVRFMDFALVNNWFS